MYKHPLFNNVDITKYEKNFKIVNYPENSLIFHEGDECFDLGIILKGQVVISTLTTLEKEYIINILNKNDIFGDVLLFSDTTLYLGDGITKKESTILYINKDLLLDMFKNDSFLSNYLSLIAKKNIDLRNRLKLLSHKNIEERILFYLSSESKRLKSKKIPIKSKESLALLLNIPRPSLSRELRKLKEKQIVDYDRYFIVLKV